MQKLILLLLFALPVGLLAQSDAEVKIRHEQATKRLMAYYPNAKKIDIDKLTAEQKDQHKLCNTCGSKKALTPFQATSITSPQTLEALKANQKRLQALLDECNSSPYPDATLVEKYQHAIDMGNEQIRVVEKKLAIQSKQK